MYTLCIYTVYSPERRGKFVDQEADGIDVGEDNEGEPKLLGDWTVGGIEEGSCHH